MLDGLVGLFFLILMGVMVIIFLSSKRKSRKLKNLPIPDHLGVRAEIYLPAVNVLEQSLPESYKEAVKNRILKKHPDWHDYEFEWIFFELKRFFLINTLLKSVPMFSTRVDDLWHEMLMFTREYELFSKNVYHELLHHVPNPDHPFMSEERGFFDWIYLSLFDTTPNSRDIWGGFLQQPINRAILDDFRKMPNDDLMRKYFRNNSDLREMNRVVIRKLKNEIFESDDVKQGKKSLAIPPTSSEQHYFQYALGAAVFYSIYEDDQFQEQMQEWQPSEYYKTHPGGGSSCSGFACSTSNDYDSGGGNGGDSSCSSCSGGCSS
ncbi:hypothetical protein [Niallia oryzisoli]|uniref:hypothetical protein n=1 Tax=Niallia oryzisoli TaxID=1737571 RepID=UPI0037351BEC